VTDADGLMQLSVSDETPSLMGWCGRRKQDQPPRDSGRDAGV